MLDAIADTRKLKQPSCSYGSTNLYMHGPLEELTKDNLSKVRSKADAPLRQHLWLHSRLPVLLCFA